MADTVGMQDIRGTNVDSAVKGFALMQFKMKQICLDQSSSNWREDYYQEGADELTGGTGEAVKGVPRLAEFPYLEPNWTLQSSYHIKHAGMGVVSYEDALTDAIPVVARTALRIGRAIAYSVDDDIYNTITSDASVNTLAASATWDNATVADRDPIGDILHGIEYMAVDNYDALENGYLLLSPEDYTNVLMNTKVVNNPSFKTADVVSNGVVGQVCGLKIIVSNAVDADEAAIVVGQLAVTYKTAVPLQTAVEYHPGVKYVISAWEIGVTQVINPEAIHIITNTQA